MKEVTRKEQYFTPKLTAYGQVSTLTAAKCKAPGASDDLADTISTVAGWEPGMSCPP